MTGILPVCGRPSCHHPYDWHRLDDALDLDLTDPATPFRCLGYDPGRDGPIPPVCDCPDLIRDPTPRGPSQAEENIARAWVVRHHWTNAQDAAAEYAHALALLVFANARPPHRRPGGAS